MANADPRWLTQREQSAWRAFLRAHSLLLARLHRQLQADAGLSLSDYEVLAYLSESADGRLRVFELGAGMQWEKSRLSHHLRRMEQRGLVARADCPTDARGAFVVLTDQSRRAIELAAPLHVEEVRRSFVEPLTRAQLDSVMTIAQALIDAADDGADGE